MSYRSRLFVILWSAGLAGVLSFLTVDLPALIAVIPPPDGPPVELPPPAVLKLASIAQPTFLMSLAVLFGVFKARCVGLHAPAAEAAAGGEVPWQELKPQILPGITAGVLSGFAIIATWLLFKPSFSSEFVDRAESFNAFIPHAVRILYGGFTEEILLRWGVMTLFVWIAWRVFQKGQGMPKDIYMVGAILGSALLFGAGHLPIASALNGGLDLPIILYVITGNSIFGIVAGFLYWRRGLESAMLAHIFAHVVLIFAIWMAI